MYYFVFSFNYNRVGGVMVSVLAASVVDRGFKPRWVKPKTMKLVFVASPLHVALRGKSKDWLTRNQYNVLDWSDMSTWELLFK